MGCSPTYLKKDNGEAYLNVQIIRQKIYLEPV